MPRLLTPYESKTSETNVLTMPSSDFLTRSYPKPLTVFINDHVMGLAQVPWGNYLCFYYAIIVRFHCNSMGCHEHISV